MHFLVTLLILAFATLYSYFPFPLRSALAHAGHLFGELLVPFN